MKKQKVPGMTQDQYEHYRHARRITRWIKQQNRRRRANRTT